MGRKLDRVIVVDLEASCWPSKEEEKEKGPTEIIEIGVAHLDLKTWEVGTLPCPKCERRDKKGERLEDCLYCQGRRGVDSIIVKPEHSEISNYCTELTTLTKEFIDHYGIPFEDAVNRLIKIYGPKNRIWASWGDYDRMKFSSECVAKNVKYPFSASHENVKNLFAMTYQLDKSVGMSTALEMIDKPLIGTHHRGADDAWNIARLLAVCLSGDEANGDVLI